MSYVNARRLLANFSDCSFLREASDLAVISAASARCLAQYISWRIRFFDSSSSSSSLLEFVLERAVEVENGLSLSYESDIFVI